MRLVTEEERRAAEAAKQQAHRLETQLRDKAADERRQHERWALHEAAEHEKRRQVWRGRTVRGHMCEGLVELNAANSYGPYINIDGYLEGDDDNPVRLVCCPMCGVTFDE